MALLNGKIAGVPLLLKVKMEEQNIRGLGKRVFPRVFLHLPYSIEQVISRSANETFALKENFQQLPATQIEVLDDSEFEDVTEYN
jgi:hypothetical protein